MARPVRRGSKRPPESLGSLIPKVLDEMGLSDTSIAVALLRRWDSALGETFAPHCRPDGLRRGVVQARVRDSAWMQRLQLEKPRILARLREALGEDEITDMRLRIGSVDER